ncbi:hypothetical protein [Mesorhizobium sp.]|uniref:hypothetical protein n=1 Tax=Mesorhizobium sp. TaxID=1871066 RepID=UPI0011F41436|nr:hypothetical protein [Mesorhizobium sp.]TIN83063.1 MAG: hypothetical protein E5X97_27400 [Mesorhizobium sp.]
MAVALADKFNALLAARSAPEAGKVVVKPLEWHEPSSKNNHCWTADSPFGTYSVVNEDGWYACRDEAPRDFYFEWSWRDMSRDNLLTAQAACQADYEQRILSALASAPAPAGAEPARAVPQWYSDYIGRAKTDAQIEEELLSHAAKAVDTLTDDNWHTEAAVVRDLAVALTSLSVERDALAKKVQAFRDDGLVQAAMVRQGALQEELDEAREANRKLHRRVQKFEGAETSFRMSFASWAKVLFRAESTPERRPDFESWQREIDKEFASGRAEAAEARATASEAEASDLRRKLEEARKALEWHTMDSAPRDGTVINVIGRYPDAAAGFPRYAALLDQFDGTGDWFELSRNKPERIIPWAWRHRDEWPQEPAALAASPSAQTDGGGDGR